MSYKVVEVNRIDVIGRLWLPPDIAAYTYDLSPFQIDQIGELNRKNIRDWLDKNAGDFSEVIDFTADIGDFYLDWSKDNSEGIWLKCIGKNIDDPEANDID